MACNNCHTNHPNASCPTTLRFELQGTYLVPRLNGVPLEPVDLAPLVRAGETDTRLQLDPASSSLVYSSEEALEGDGTEDNILVLSIAELISLNQLGNVSTGLESEGDLLLFGEGGQWTPYTIPNGTIISEVGVDEDGKLVKEAPGGDPQQPVALPLSAIIAWPGPANTIPANCLRCEGQALSRAVYADLFDLIGTIYGAGDGSTTFNIPDVRDRAIVGVGTGEFDSLGATAGAKTVALTSANNGPHSHSMQSAGAHTHNLRGRNNLGNDSGSGGVQWSPILDTRSGGVNSAGNHSHTINSSGNGTPHNNIQPSRAMYWIMRVT